MGVGVRLWIALVGLDLAAEPAAAQATQACLDATGMAFEGGHSAVVVAGTASWLFGGPGGGVVSCGLPDEDLLSVSAGSDSALAGYAVGVGAYWTTGTIAGPNGISAARAYIQGNLIYSFQVVRTIRSPPPPSRSRS